MWYNIIIQIKDGDPKTQKETEVAKYKVQIDFTQHGEQIVSRQSSFETADKYHSVASDKKARDKASKITRKWIEANCRKRLLGEGYIRKAKNWTYNLLPERTFEVMGGQVHITLYSIFS